MFAQQVVHLPKLALRPGSFRHFRCFEGLRVFFGGREVAEHIAQFPAQPPIDLPKKGKGSDAMRALEITIFDKRDRRFH